MSPDSFENYDMDTEGSGDPTSTTSESLDEIPELARSISTKKSDDIHFTDADTSMDGTTVHSLIHYGVRAADSSNSSTVNVTGNIPFVPPPPPKKKYNRTLSINNFQNSEPI